MSDANLFEISLDGPEVTLDTVDPKLMLELAMAYVKALTAVADDDDRVLGLRGLHTLPGSAKIAFATSDMPGTQECAHTVNGLVHEEVAPSYIQPLRSIILGLATGFTVYVANQNWREPVVTVAPSGTRREVMSARVRVIRAGGARPAIRVEDVVKGYRYTVITSDAKQAQELAQFLYREIDVKVEITRRPDGGFVDGELIKFTPLDDVDPLEAWRAWFAPHDEHWKGIAGADLARAIKR